MASKVLLLYHFKMVYSNNIIKLHRDMVNNTSDFGLHRSNIFGFISIVESAFLRSKGKKKLDNGVEGMLDFGLDRSSVQVLKVKNPS